MKQQIDNDAIIKRLRRVEGQVRGVIKTVEAGKSCEDILIQISSVRASAQKAAQFVLEEHMENCVIEGVRRGRAGETVKKLTAAIEQFAKLV